MAGHREVVPARGADCGLVPQIMEEIMDGFSWHDGSIDLFRALGDSQFFVIEGQGGGVARSFTPEGLAMWQGFQAQTRHFSGSVRLDVETQWR